MQIRKNNRRAWIWLAVLLILFMFISYFSSSQKTKIYPAYVSDSPSPTGVKALFTYLDNEKGSVKGWNHSPLLLPTGNDKQILFVIEPYFMPESKELDAYKAFMEAGNTILLFNKNPKGMFDLNTVLGETHSSTDEEPNVYGLEEKVFRGEINSPMRLQANEQDKILLYDEAGPIAIKRDYGKGKLIVSISPEWIVNGKLLDYDHIPLVISLINEGNAGTFLFDEYIHGAQNASTIGMLYPKWFLLLMLQGILMTLLWLWYAGKRFGPIIVPREETVRFSDEGIRALAAWYIRGRRYHDSLLIQADFVKLLLQERWGIPYSKEWKDLSEQFERKSPKMPKLEISTFLKGLVNILEKEKISKQEYLLWSKKLDRLQKEVDAE